MRKAAIIILVLALLPSMPMVIAGAWYFNTASWCESAIKSQGTVIELIEKEGDNNTLYAPVFSYSIDGIVYTKQSSISSHPQPYKVGDAVTILADPSDHHDAIIDSWEYKYLSPLVLGIVSGIPSLLLFFLGFLLLVISILTKKET